VSTDTRGYDAGKKINGRKRHIVVDTIGLLLVVMVTAASVQDRDGARGTLERLHSALSSVSHIFADGGYIGQLLAVAKSAWSIVVEIVRKPADQIGFAVLPRRWVLERTFLVADALAAPGARLRTATRDPRSDGQVGDGRDHAQPARSTTRTQTHGHPRKRSNDPSKTPSKRFVSP